jgi:hypothetical protein
MQALSASKHSVLLSQEIENVTYVAWPYIRYKEAHQDANCDGKRRRYSSDLRNKRHACASDMNHGGGPSSDTWNAVVVVAGESGCF